MKDKIILRRAFQFFFVSANPMDLFGAKSALLCLFVTLILRSRCQSEHSQWRQLSPKFVHDSGIFTGKNNYFQAYNITDCTE